jgi:Na+/H+-translocating membrane pyrophosphatase
MKKMILPPILIGLLGVLATYIAIAFIFLEPNPVKWSEMQREIIVIAFVLCAYVTAMYNDMNKSKK